MARAEGPITKPMSRATTLIGRASISAAPLTIRKRMPPPTSLGNRAGEKARQHDYDESE